MIDKLQLFHGGFGSAPPVWPLSHFGTRRAAMKVLENKKMEGARLGGIKIGTEQIPCTDEHAYLIEIEVAFPKRVLEITDYGTPKPLGLLYAGIDAIGKQLNLEGGYVHELKKERRSSLAKYYANPTCSEIGSRDFLEGRRFVLNYLSQYYDAVAYANNVEDKGEKSWVLLYELTDRDVVSVTRGSDVFAQDGLASRSDGTTLI